MPAIRSIADIAAKWSEVTPQRAPQYEFGVKNPKKNWEENAKAANDAWKSGVQAAVQQDRFVKGVGRAGQQKWVRGAVEKGVARFGPGVQIARDEYQRGFAPYRDAIERAELPQRFARRDPRNIERVRAMVQALVQEKMRQLGAAS